MEKQINMTTVADCREIARKFNMYFYTNDYYDNELRNYYGTFKRNFH